MQIISNFSSPWKELVGNTPMVFKIWQPSASTPSLILDISPWKSVEMRSPHFHLFVWFSQELLHQFLQCIDDRALGDIAPELVKFTPDETHIPHPNCHMGCGRAVNSVEWSSANSSIQYKYLKIDLPDKRTCLFGFVLNKIIS
jgi:hypothetical protein